MEKDSNENKIPRELLHDQHERLSNKHIKTLAFLQQIAKENKDLKEKIHILEEKLETCKSHHGLMDDSKEELQNIKEAYLQRADEITKLAAKHSLEVMRLQEEKYERERELKEQIIKMRHEIESLKAANNDLRETVAEENESESKQKEREILNQKAFLEKQNEELRNEIESLREDLDLVQTKSAKEMTKLQDLKEENKHLKQSLQEVQQKVNESEFRLDKALKELSDKSKAEEEDSLIETLHEKVQTLQQDYQKRLQYEDQMKQDLRDLQSLKDEVMKTNFHLQNELENILGEYGQLALEFNKLKKHSKDMQDKKSFKDFVSLKRELNVLRDENDFLKSRTKSDFVMLKEDILPLPPSLPKKKNSFDATRNGSKKVLAITLDSNGT